MSTKRTIIEKLRFTLTQPDITFTLPTQYAGVNSVGASHLKWLTYVTATSGNTDMTIQIPELGDGGTKILDTKGSNNKKYYVSMPLDPSAQVTNIYSNYTGAIDKEYNIPKTITTISFKVLINGLLANDVTTSNPIELELVLYR